MQSRVASSKGEKMIDIFLSRQKDINMGIKGNALYSVNMGVSFEERSMNFAFMIGNQRLLFVIGLHRAGDVAQLKDMY
jgi:hypothetical protein